MMKRALFLIVLLPSLLFAPMIAGSSHAAYQVAWTFNNEGSQSFILQSFEPPESNLGTIGAQDPMLTLKFGQRYQVTIINDQTHPFEVIARGSNAGEDEVLLSMSSVGLFESDPEVAWQDDGLGTVGFTLTLDLYAAMVGEDRTPGYRCAVHASAMRGDFNIEGVPDLPGDVNGDKTTDLTDALLSVKVISGLGSPEILSDYTSTDADLNSDGKIGLEDAGGVFQILKGIRITSPPAAPADLQAAALSSWEVELAWTDRSFNEAGFKIERSLGTPDAFTEIAVVGRDVVSYHDSSGLGPNTTCHYRLKAYNVLGESAYAEAAPVVTPELPSFTLNVEKSGNGQGTVTGSGIDCGSDCMEDYLLGTQVTLTADAQIDSTFVGWSGCENPSGNQCTVIMDKDTTVTAQFDLECSNLAGTWHVTRTVVSTSCPGELGQVNYGTYYVIQDGCSFTINSSEGSFQGTVAGNTASWSAGWSEDGGWTDAEIDITFSGDHMDGSSSWTWSGYGESCWGVTDVEGYRD